jgi:peptidyl-prolyl isomerase E (cyclophilin E)
MSDRKILYVAGLDESVTKQLLFSAFIPFGDIVDVKLPLDYKTQKNRGFGFVEYEDPQDARAAVENMDNSELCGKVLSVSIANPTAMQNLESERTLLSSNEVEELAKTIKTIGSTFVDPISESLKKQEDGEPEQKKQKTE